MNDLDHVHPKLWCLFDCPDLQRIRYIVRDQYVSYRRAKELLDDIDELVNGERSDRPDCTLVVGEPGMGKTTLLEVVEKKHPPYVCEQTLVIMRPVVRINVSGAIDLRIFYQRILRALQIPYGESDRPGTLEANAHRGLTDADTRLLAIDELHNFFIAGAKALITHMAVLRDLTNTPSVALLCAGTSPAEYCIQADAQLDERFDRYKLGPWTECVELRNFLANLERRLPLRLPSGLAGPVLLPLLLSLSGGHMKRMVRIIRRAAKMAVVTGVESLDIEGLRLAAQRLVTGYGGDTGGQSLGNAEGMPLEVAEDQFDGDK
ncbi:TniB family NTP-binding protein [Dyella sp. Tek66A03]|uniref:TniB family NTP-binding protein n=1 Tax=Dyella sp. Tek66A03 TaxID=3458298 RepID=UPI00403E66EC